MRVYRYVGEAELRSLGQETPRASIQKASDVLRGMQETGQVTDAEGSLTATFIVSEAGILWIADRHSEHVWCARGESVLAAGEMTFTVTRRGDVSVSAVTNQSTGYCPEPESWPAVAAALERVGIPHPEGYTTAFLFRRCGSCGMRNIVKDDWFVCGVCAAALPQAWNFGVPGKPTGP